MAASTVSGPARRGLRLATAVLLAGLFLAPPVPAGRVPVIFTGQLWQGEFDNGLRYANPFDPAEVELALRFTSPGGEEHQVSGYYVGDGAGGHGALWRARFVPDEAGLWRYTYEWSDGAGAGSGLILVHEDKLAKLAALTGTEPPRTAPAPPFEEIPYYVAIPGPEIIDQPEGEALLDYIRDALGANGVAFVLGNRVWADCAADDVPCTPYSGLLDLGYWDQVDRLMQALEARRLGANVMFYYDGDGRPGFEGRSSLEWLLTHYAVARLAAYPRVSFDSGIDILEYRDSDWSEWFAARLAALDPYGRPVGSRHGGGSGEFECASCSYDSRGDIHPTYEEMRSAIEGAGKPVFFTDRWRVGFTRGDFDTDGMRRAMWEAMLAGGAGFILGGRNGPLRPEDFRSDLGDTAQYLAFGHFWSDPARDRADYQVCNERISTGLCYGSDGVEYVVYLPDGGTVNVDLAAWTVLAEAAWLNPRTGERTALDPVAAGGEVAFTAPDGNDWVLQVAAPPLPKLLPLITRVIGIPPPPDL